MHTEAAFNTAHSASILPAAGPGKQSALVDRMIVTFFEKPGPSTAAVKKKKELIVDAACVKRAHSGRPLPHPIARLVWPALQSRAPTAAPIAPLSPESALRCQVRASYCTGSTVPVTASLVYDDGAVAQWPRAAAAAERRAAVEWPWQLCAVHEADAALLFCCGYGAGLLRDANSVRDFVSADGMSDSTPALAAR